MARLSEAVTRATTSRMPFSSPGLPSPRPPLKFIFSVGASGDPCTEVKEDGDFGPFDEIVVGQESQVPPPLVLTPRRRQV